MDFNTLNSLLTSLKRIIEERAHINIPKMGNSDKIVLKSSMFYYWVDINRKGRKKQKFTLQLRDQEHKDTPLLRLDLLGPDHPNPPGDYPLANQDIPCPHLHIAHPEYGISIAYPLNTTYANIYLSKEEFDDIIIILKRFLERCNVANIEDYNYDYQAELF